MIRKAVIPAAGYGTRFLPATKVVPKELLPVVDRPALEWIVEELADSGIEAVILVVNSGKESIREHFARGNSVEKMLLAKDKIHLLDRHHRLIDRVQFFTAYQDKPKGLGHAVLSARSIVGNEPFAVVLPDDLVQSQTPCLKQLMDVYAEQQESVVAVQYVPISEVEKYGIVKGGKDDAKEAFRVTGITEKPTQSEAQSRWAIIGRYVLDPSVFEALENTRPGAIGEIQLTDALESLAKTKGLWALPFEGRRMDAGQPPGWIEANLRYAMKDPNLAGQIRKWVREFSDGGDTK